MGRTGHPGHERHSCQGSVALNMAKDPVQAYLNGYAEPIIHSSPDLHHPVDWAICIPVCNEDARFLDTLTSVSKMVNADRCVLILVVNGAEDAPGSVHQGNQQFLRWLRELFDIEDGLWAQGSWNRIRFMVVDQASSGRRFPAGQGVGLARKIASDLVLEYQRRGQICRSWMACTDADVILPSDYLQQLEGLGTEHSAALYPFEHTLEGSAAQQAAMCAYECFLHYYVLGLHWAGSPYAHHSIGSSFAIHAHYYAVVRGFPRRKAAEDFYLLNKLVKQAPFHSLQGGAIQIRGRLSNRVPFGTGRALDEIQQLDEPYRVYDPRVFLGVRRWNQVLHTIDEQPADLNWEACLEVEGLPPGVLFRSVRDLGAISAVEKARKQLGSGPHLARRLMEWNDAFRTLRLIHLLRDSGVASIALEEALRVAPFVPAQMDTSPAVARHTLRKRVSALVKIGPFR